MGPALMPEVAYRCPTGAIRRLAIANGDRVGGGPVASMAPIHGVIGTIQ